MAATPEERLNLYLAAASSGGGVDVRPAEPSPPEMSVCDYLCLLYRGDMPVILDCCVELRFWHRWRMRADSRLARAIRRRRRRTIDGNPAPSEISPAGTPRPGSQYTDDQIQEYEARELDLLHCFDDVRDDYNSGAGDFDMLPTPSPQWTWTTDEEYEQYLRDREQRFQNCCVAAKAVRDCLKSRCYQVCNYNFDTCSGDCLNINPPLNPPVVNPYYDRQ